MKISCFYLQRKRDKIGVLTSNTGKQCPRNYFCNKYKFVRLRFCFGCLGLGTSVAAGIQRMKEQGELWVKVMDRVLVISRSNQCM